MRFFSLYSNCKLEGSWRKSWSWRFIALLNFFCRRIASDLIRDGKFVWRIFRLLPYFFSGLGKKYRSGGWGVIVYQRMDSKIVTQYSVSFYEGKSVRLKSRNFGRQVLTIGKNLAHALPCINFILTMYLDHESFTNRRRYSIWCYT